MIAFCFISLVALAANQPREVVPDIKRRVDQLPATVIDYERSLLTDKEKQVVGKLIEASRFIDEIFWQMVSEENTAVRKELESHPNRLAVQYFNIMKGRWDRIEENKPFISPFG